MNKRIGFIGLISFIVLSSFAYGGYDAVIKQAKNKKVKRQLVEFKRGGIEKKWPKTFKKTALVKAARKYKGTKYKYGGLSKRGLDCSGLVCASMKDIGVNLPHKSSELARYGKVISSKKKLKAGDLVFFKGDKRLINHVGIMISNTEFIHMSSSRGFSKVDLTNDYYWPQRFLFGTR